MRKEELAKYKANEAWLAKYAQSSESPQGRGWPIVTGSLLGAIFAISVMLYFSLKQEVPEVVKPEPEMESKFTGWYSLDEQGSLCSKDKSLIFCGLFEVPYHEGYCKIRVTFSIDAAPTISKNKNKILKRLTELDSVFYAHFEDYWHQCILEFKIKTKAWVNDFKEGFTDYSSEMKLPKIVALFK